MAIHPYCHPHPTIFLDVDQTLLDFVGAALRARGLDRNVPWVKYVLYEGGGYGKKFEELFCGKEEFIKCIAQQGPEFWRHLEPFPWADSLVDALYNKMLTRPDLRLAFLTSPGHWPANSAGQRILHMGELWQGTPTIICSQKELCAGPYSFLIDDLGDNCDNFKRRGGHVFKFTNAEILLDAGTTMQSQVISDISNEIDQWLTSIDSFKEALATCSIK